jgi:LmbE family N-acetylglucosaminyl deacetylase
MIAKQKSTNKVISIRYLLYLLLLVAIFVVLLRETVLEPKPKILIIAPHQDDEVISCAGVIERAISNGNDVRVMYITDGNYEGIEELRCKESINAMATLGLSKDKIYYLAYGDKTVLENAYNSKNDPTLVFQGKQGQRETSGWDYLMLDYHFEKYGIHASYCRKNILFDIQDIINNFRPDDIFIPSAMGAHPDHAKTSEFTTEAIINIKADADYSPNIHEYMIYTPYLPPYEFDKDAIPVLNTNSTDADVDNKTIYKWNDRESIPVPSNMMSSINSLKNIKERALECYGSQGAFNFYRFIKSDEIFWKRKMSSLSYKADVTASSENTARGQGCINIKDGITLGEPYDGTKEWATLNEKDNAWVKLTWADKIKSDHIVLYDRPNLKDHILQATLSFSDGTSISVDALPNNGSPYNIKFPLKIFSWVKLTINKCDGDSIGLSEFEVCSTFSCT